MGQVVRAHGLRGHVVVELWTNRPERMEPGARLEGPAGLLEVLSASRLSPAGGRERWLVGFAGVSDRMGAERLRGAVLRAEPLDDPDALWVHELIGAEVFDIGGQRVGKVAAVEANPASDLLVLEDGRLIPLRFVRDRRPGAVTADLPPGLLDL